MQKLAKQSAEGIVHPLTKLFKKTCGELRIVWLGTARFLMVRGSPTSEIFSGVGVWCLQCVCSLGDLSINRISGFESFSPERFNTEA